MGAARYKPYPAYKSSGVEWSEEFPDEWEATRFKNLFTIKKRIAGKIGPDVLSITQKGIKVKDLESGEGQLASDYSKYQHVYAGDFAMNHMDLLTGYVDISKYDGVTSPDYRVFSLDRDDCHPAFYLYILQHCYHAKIFFPLGQGAAHLGRWRLPAEAFNTFVAPVPSLPEQTKIAAFLDYETGKIDALIAKQERLIALLEEKRQAVISHAVTKGLDPTAPLRPSGIDWLGDVPEHWESAPIKYMALEESSLFLDGDWIESKDISESGIRYITTGNVGRGRYKEQGEGYITERTFKKLDATEVFDGDILISRLNAPIGRACIVPNLGSRIVTSVDNVVFRPDSRFDRRFVVYMLSSQEYFSKTSNIARGATMQRISRGLLGNIRIAFPPLLEQAEIASHLIEETSALDKLTEKARSVATLLKERRTALISAAVTGKIDVRDWQPPQPHSDTDLSTETLQEAAL